jgi:uncharacterized membrane protein YkvA (DUF1232 family)
MSPRRRSGGGSRLTKALNLLAFMPLASRGPIYGRLLLALAVDPRVPASRKALLALAAGYVLSPIDLIPDRIPFVGALDDVAVIVLAVDLFLDGLPEGLIDEKLAELGVPRSELDNDLQRVRRTVPAPVRAAAARLPEALEAVASVAHSTGLDERLRELVSGSRQASGGDGARRTQTQMEEVPA